MGNRKSAYRPKSFESSRIKDTSANIYTSMLLSPAWQDLTAAQKTLYLHMKERMYGQTNSTRPMPDRLKRFTFPKRIWCNLFGLYARTNQGGFFWYRASRGDYGRS